MMTTVISLLSAAALSIAPPPVTADDQGDTKSEIIRASESLLDPGTGRGEMIDSLLELLDIAASITTASQYKDQIQYRINIAKDLLRRDSLFNPKARQYLSFAYRMMTDGRKYQKPEELDEFVTPAEAMEKSRRYSRKLIEEAISSLEDGRQGETARLLMELVLGVVTPVAG